MFAILARIVLGEGAAGAFDLSNSPSAKDQGSLAEGVFFTEFKGFIPDAYILIVDVEG